MVQVQGQMQLHLILQETSESGRVVLIDYYLFTKILVVVVVVHLQSHSVGSPGRFRAPDSDWKRIPSGQAGAHPE